MVLVKMGRYEDEYAGLSHLEVHRFWAAMSVLVRVFERGLKRWQCGLWWTAISGGAWISSKRAVTSCTVNTTNPDMQVNNVASSAPSVYGQASSDRYRTSKSESESDVQAQARMRYAVTAPTVCRCRGWQREQSPHQEMY
jgi:hypothetical protein